MPIETNNQRGLETSPLLLQETRDAANRWLVRFTPLTDPPERLDADDCHQRLRQLPALRDEGQRVRSALQRDAGTKDAELLSTIQAALEQLEPLERDLRLRISAIAPADPEGAADLANVRARLAQVSARHEVAEAVGEDVGVSGRLELPVSRPNWIAALFPAIFAFGWLSFTTFHAIFMISGAMKSFGLMGFALLGFYSIFFMVGFAMVWAAICAASSESLTLEQKEAAVTRRFVCWTWSRRCALGPETRAYKTRANASSSSDFSQVVAISGTDRELRFGANAPSVEQDRLVRRVNAYLGVGELSARG